MKLSICLKGINQQWSPGNDFENYNKYFKKYGFSIKNSFLPINQIVYLPNRYLASKTKLRYFKNKLVFDYFHGDPKITPEFKNLFLQIKNNIHKFSKIRVTNSVIENLFQENNLEEKISKIYLGVETDIFKFNHNFKKKLKDKLNISDDVTVLGSFQKDSNGWNNSKSPKLIKGPDILVETLKKIFSKYSKIFVILVGPQREYIKAELDKIGINYAHFEEKNYHEVAKYYSLIDFLFITSREEGGPKSLLEAMSCGVPVISTPVGQAKDIINNKNSILSNTFDSSEISDIFFSLKSEKNLEEIKRNAFNTAKKHDFNNQKDIWTNFFSDL